ncbi:hypothetical protein CPC735_058820 [Coccidioides posadasii C735 delta SOWgp]|uniref:Sister chromatid cohesion protein Dcc1 n=1 Tax=Coccidioides posadasii (strain C735) TaxID=222929 RepID=C5PEJ2_COCP7|nr:hypothetical protein CPC735_058820 [Coccidioides posadasii C735 delta SOWgp]EER24512.1 hypothetical protein CPC735_058820 [Coccidioides posadasii C735 delta SOWgp]|eukprot:XP_003066657.1 hypothetical protein CPC735_058820 [Coccidioides posadasii C735 delta SOWgp]
MDHMEKQTALSIPFTHTAPQEAFRLLELPEELLALLTSDEAPPLYLKSPPPSISAARASSGSSSNQGTDDAFVNLCTDTKTYSLRQVHSSNSIFVLRPSPLLDNSRKEDGGVLETDASDAVTAIALCKSTLELQSVGKGYSALPFLLRNLQVYDMVDIEEDAMDVDTKRQSDLHTPPGTAERRKALDGLFTDIPLSPTECYEAWVDVCGFIDEDRNSGNLVGWRPSAASKLSAWKKLLEVSILQGIDLSKQFLVRDLWNSVVDDSDTSGAKAPFPRSLFYAIVRRLMDDSPSGIKLQVFEGLKWSNLNREITINWVGDVYLEAMAPNPRLAVPEREFLETWRDLIPEKWRIEVTAEKFKDISCQHITSSSICFCPNTGKQGDIKPVKGKMSR